MPRNMISPDGDRVTVPDEQIEALTGLGYTLETTGDLRGGWAPAPGTSPAAVDPSAPQAYYRLRGP